MIDMKHRQHLWVTRLAPAKQPKPCLGNMAVPTFSSAMGVIGGPSEAGLGTLSPPQGGQKEGRMLVAASTANVPHCLLSSQHIL